MKRSLVVILSLLLACTPIPKVDITVTDPVIKRPLKGKSTAVAYLVLHNNSATPKILTGVQSSIAGAIEIHTYIQTNDKFLMQHLDELKVPAHSELIFKPAGNHLMLFRINGLDTVPAVLNFQFSDGSNYSAEFSIEDY
ncbi:MAG: copper chaperone PCu(A)C [Pseudomonadales bacterium]|nr:copper chaperone PCu(A)C [Pseudomonadales bacterium]